jgi:hypothetical protein
MMWPERAGRRKRKGEVMSEPDTDFGKIIQYNGRVYMLIQYIYNGSYALAINYNERPPAQVYLIPV